MRYLSKQEKTDTRALWKKCFAPVSPAFLDYYYTRKTKDNEILIEEVRGKLAGMLHRNPKWIYLKGAGVTSELLCGIAVDEEFRGLGIATSLLSRALRDEADAQIPFSFLVPVPGRTDLPCGFRYTIMAPEKQLFWWEGLGLHERDSREDLDRELADFVNICLARDGGFFVQRTADYFRDLRRVHEAVGGGVKILQDEHGILTGYYHYYEENGERRIVEAVFRPAFRDRHVPKGGERVPQMMTRITCLMTFLRCFTIPEEELEALRRQSEVAVHVRIDVRDPLIPANNGQFIWTFWEARSHLMIFDEERQHLEEAIGHIEPMPVQMNVSDLAEWLFGAVPFEELVRIGSITGPEDSLNILRLVKPLQHIFVREEY